MIVRRIIPALIAMNVIHATKTGASEQRHALYVAANHPFIQYTGRFHARANEAMSCAWPGSQITIRFCGSAVDAVLEDESKRNEHGDQGTFILVLLDGRPHVKLGLQPGTHTYRVADQIEEGEHILTLFKQTEASVGTVTFRAFLIDDGKLLPPPSRPERRVAFYGDSITCGFGNEGLLATDPFLPSTENHYLTFAQITARHLHAEAHVMAWSGEGISRNALGDVVHPLPTMHHLILPPKPETAWDHAAWTPDVVVINLGSNDFLSGIPDQEAFVGGYLNFVEDLYHWYGNPVIFCCLGPMINGVDAQGKSKLTAARDYLEILETQIVRLGYPPIHLLEFSPLGDDERGALWHPNLAAHHRMATTLAEAIIQITGWQRK